MTTEHNAFIHNKTWTLVPSSQALNIVGCKWVFRIKYKPDGSIDRLKARLVAKGSTKDRELTMLRLLVQLSNPQPFALFFPLLSHMVGVYANSTLIMLSYRVL